MIRNPQMVEAFEEEQMRTCDLDPQRVAERMDALYEQARQLGVFPLRDPLEGLDEKVRFVRALHGFPATSEDCDGA